MHAQLENTEARPSRSPAANAMGSNQSAVVDPRHQDLQTSRSIGINHLRLGEFDQALIELTQLPQLGSQI